MQGSFQFECFTNGLASCRAWKVYLRDSKQRFQLFRVVSLTRKQELILKPIDESLLASWCTKSRAKSGHESAKHAPEQRRKHARWLDADDPGVVANAMLIMTTPEIRPFLGFAMFWLANGAARGILSAV